MLAVPYRTPPLRYSIFNQTALLRETLTIIAEKWVICTDFSVPMLTVPFRTHPLRYSNSAQTAPP